MLYQNMNRRFLTGSRMLVMHYIKDCIPSLLSSVYKNNICLHCIHRCKHTVLSYCVHPLLHCKDFLKGLSESLNIIFYLQYMLSLILWCLLTNYIFTMPPSLAPLKADVDVKIYKSEESRLEVACCHHLFPDEMN